MLHTTIAAYLEKGPMWKRVSEYDTLDDLLTYLSTDEINKVTSDYLLYIFQQSHSIDVPMSNNSNVTRAFLASFIFAKFYIEQDSAQALHWIALRLTTIMDSMTLCFDGQEEDDFAEDPTGITAIFLECLSKFMEKLEAWSKVYTQPSPPVWLGLMLKAVKCSS